MDLQWMNYRRAVEAFDLADYRTSISLLRRLAEESPSAVEIRLLLARSYYHSAALEPALTELRAVLDIDPTEAYAQLLLARTLERQSRPEEARKHRKLAAALTGDESMLATHQAGR